MTLCIPIGLSLAGATPAAAQATFRFDWRASGTVTHFTEALDQESTIREERRGTGTLTLVRDPSPDVRFAFDFAGPDGGGSGLVPRAAEQAVDPNFAFPNPLPPGLPPAQSRSVRGSFTRSAGGPLPGSFEIVYFETFICRAPPEACGNVKRWDVVFTGTAHLAPGGSR